MSSVLPLALVIDYDFGFLGRAALAVARSGYQVSARLSPRGLRDFTGILRPELILLGLPFWEQGWAHVLRTYSPDSIVYPIASQSDDPGVADLARLPDLLGALRPEEAPGETSHAA